MREPKLCMDVWGDIEREVDAHSYGPEAHTHADASCMRFRHELLDLVAEHLSSCIPLYLAAHV